LILDYESEFKNARVLLVDLEGRIVNEQRLINHPDRIDMSNMSDALYFLQVITEKGNTFTYKLSKNSH
jgi:hypothetical protein